MTWVNDVPGDEYVPQIEERYPLIQWQRQWNLGQGLVPGGFFLPSDKVPPNWRLAIKPVSVGFESGGAPKPGYVFPGLHIAVLPKTLFRVDWGVYRTTPGAMFPRKVPIGSYEAAKIEAHGDRMTARRQVLCLVKELGPHYGPVMINIWGETGRSLGDAINLFFGVTYQAICAHMDHQLPVWGLWIPLRAGPQRPSKEGAANITPVELAVKEENLASDRIAEYSAKVIVSDEVAALAKKHWADANEWATAPLQPQVIVNQQQPEAQGDAPFQGGSQSSMVGGQPSGFPPGYDPRSGLNPSSNDWD